MFYRFGDSGYSWTKRGYGELENCLRNLRGDKRLAACASGALYRSGGCVGDRGFVFVSPFKRYGMGLRLAIRDWRICRTDFMYFNWCVIILP